MGESSLAMAASKLIDSPELHQLFNIFDKNMRKCVYFWFYLLVVVLILLH